MTSQIATRPPHFVDTAPFDPGASEPTANENERYYRASALTLIWWKFRRNRLAVISAFVLVGACRTDVYGAAGRVESGAGQLELPGLGTALDVVDGDVVAVSFGDLGKQRHRVVRGDEDEGRSGLERVDDAVDRRVANGVRAT